MKLLPDFWGFLEDEIPHHELFWKMIFFPPFFEDKIINEDAHVRFYNLKVLLPSNQT